MRTYLCSFINVRYCKEESEAKPNSDEHFQTSSCRFALDSILIARGKDGASRIQKIEKRQSLNNLSMH